ncbi:USP domain-containing protein, partial [Haematococcus lacustris]
MLRRESLLTKAKLHVLLWEHINQDKQLRTWKLQLKQGEPEFERLKRELDEVKHSHRGLDGTYRSQSYAQPLPSPTHCPPLLPYPLPSPAALRESLLTKAKLHVLLWEHINQDKQLRTWKLQLKQGEPEFERLKRELDEVKHSHRGLDGTYRSQAEMDRHRAQLADAAIEEQLEVQTAFREQGALLQAIYDSKLRAEHEMVKRETEVKQLQGWKGTVENLLDKFLELMAAKGQGDVAALTPTLPAPGAAPGAAAEDKPGPGVEADASAEACVRAVEQGPGGKREEQEGAAAGDRTAAAGEGDGKAGVDPTAKGQVQDQGQGVASSGAGGLTPQQFVTLNKLRAHFQKDVRKQLYSNADDRLIFDSLKAEIKLMEQRCEEGRVAVQHLEMNLINVACD